MSAHENLRRALKGTAAKSIRLPRHAAQALVDEYRGVLDTIPVLVDIAIQVGRDCPNRYGNQDKCDPLSTTAPLFDELDALRARRQQIGEADYQAERSRIVGEIARRHEALAKASVFATRLK